MKGSAPYMEGYKAPRSSASTHIAIFTEQSTSAGHGSSRRKPKRRAT